MASHPDRNVGQIEHPRVTSDHSMATHRTVDRQVDDRPVGRSACLNIGDERGTDAPGGPDPADVARRCSRYASRSLIQRSFTTSWNASPPSWSLKGYSVMDFAAA